MKYDLKAPIYFVGQTVNFTHHNKSVLYGTICSVKTSYNNRVEGRNPYGYHIYGILTPTAKKRAVWVGESSISGVVY